MARVKGKATCCVVEVGCEAPAGLRVGGGVASLPGVRGLHVCTYCGDPVCKSCSKPVERGRACSVHSVEEV